MHWLSLINPRALLPNQMRKHKHLVLRILGGIPRFVLSNRNLLGNEAVGGYHNVMASKSERERQ